MNSSSGFWLVLNRFQNMAIKSSEMENKIYEKCNLQIHEKYISQSYDLSAGFSSRGQYPSEEVRP